MDPTDLDKMSKLSPFELRNELVRRAACHSDRLMLNAGRANPNFLATVPRQAFFEIGLFAVGEAERTGTSTAEGIGGLPQAEGIVARFDRFAQTRHAALGIDFLTAALSYARRRLAFTEADFLHELVAGVLGCQYTEPVRMLPCAAEIFRHFLQKEIGRCASDRRGDRSFCSEGRHRGNNLRLQLIAAKSIASTGRQDRDRNADLYALY